MSVTAARLRTVVTADTGQAQQGLRDFGRTVSTTARAANQDLSGIGATLGQLPGALGQIGGLLGGAFTVAGVGTLLAQGGRLALTLDNQRQVAANVRKELVAYAGGAHEAAAAAAALRRATDGGISRLDAMRGASQLLGMGLVQNADQSYQMARMAVMLGDKTLGAQERMASWNAMLANQSIERLDTFGISSGRVRQRIDELMAAQAGLDRQTAFTNAVLEIGAGKLAAVEAEGVEASTSIDKVRSAWADLRLEAAKEINLDLGLGNLAGWIDWIAGRMSDEGQAQRAYAQAFDEYKQAVDRTSEAQARLGGWYAQINPLARANYEIKLEEAQAAEQAALKNYLLAQSAYNSAQGLSTEAEAADLTRTRLLGLAEAQREVAAARQGTTTGTFTEPSKTRWGLYTDWARPRQDDGRDLVKDWVARQEAANKTVATSAGKSYYDAMTQAGKEAASKINGYLSEGMNFSIGLNDMTQNPLAPGQNGPFEQIYRLQAWLKDGSWGDVAGQFGGDRGQIEGLVKSFQLGNFTPDVLKAIDLGGLRKLMQEQVAAEASQQALAGQLGGDAGVLKSLLGLDQAGQGIVLSQAESAALAKSLAGSVDTALKDNSLGVDLVAAMVASMTTELAADGGKQLEAKGAEAFDKTGAGFVKRASESPIFYRAIGAMVDSYLARELEQ